MLLTRETPAADDFGYRRVSTNCCAGPSQALIDDLRKVDGDIMILGVAGKMGPTLAGLAKAAAPERRVIGVARFSDPAVKDWLQARGVETINCDLLDEAAIEALPKVPNIVFMAGRKFGAEGDLSLTWAMNSHVPALVAQAFAASRIVAFSTGCVYPFVPVDGKGADEDMAPNPPGEYAQSCVGRERMFEYFSSKHCDAGPPVPAQLRDRHALRRAARHRQQGAAGQADRRQPRPCQFHLAGRCLRAGAALPRALRRRRPRRSMSAATRSSPCAISPQNSASASAARPVIVGKEEPTAWLTDTSQAVKLFGLPIVDTEQLISWTADWVSRSMPSLGKPTKYEVRDGRY